MPGRGEDGVSRLLKLLILVLIIVSGVLYFFVFTGVLKVDSTRPYDATVEIDGVVVGPAPVKQRVRKGTHRVKVYKEGFEAWEGEEKVSGLTSSVSVELRFMLRSEPNGATVIMDGEHVGETNMPFDLKPGAHAFEFKKDGYQVQRFNAVVPPDANEALPVVTLAVAKETSTATPEAWTTKTPPVKGYGTIQVTSTPDAQVSLDGYWKGETPLTIVDVNVGSYVITLSREGYRDLRKTVYIKKGETTRFAGELKPESVDQ